VTVVWQLPSSKVALQKYRFPTSMVTSPAFAFGAKATNIASEATVSTVAAINERMEPPWAYNETYDDRRR
jgi:hypothetical protein